MTEREVAVLLAELEAVHRNWETKPGMLTLWHDALSDLPGDAVVAAARRWRRSHPFPPAVADLRRLVADDAGLLSPPLEVAWQQALARDTDAHPAVVAARDAVGDQWRWRTEEQQWLLRDFRDFYNETRKRFDEETVTGDVLALGGATSMKQLPGGVTDE